MKILVVGLAVTLMASTIFAGMPKVDISGGADGKNFEAQAMLTWSFGAGSPPVARAAEGGGAVAVPADSSSGVVMTHLSNNWGKYLTAILGAGAYAMVAHNNEYWPYAKDDEPQVADPATATEQGASAGGGMAISISGNNNTVIIGEHNITVTAGNDVNAAPTVEPETAAEGE